MRVIARKVTVTNCPENVRLYLGQSFVTTGKDYDVYAIAVFEAVPLVQIIDDLGYPNWRPFWLFEVAESSIPRDWICNMFQNDPVLVLGPEFVAGSHAQYTAMAELERAQVDQFWAYVHAQKSRRAE